MTFPNGDVIAEKTKFDSYIKALEKIGLQQAELVAREKKYHRLNCAVIDTVQREAILNDAIYNYVKVGDYYVIKGMNGKTMRNMLSLISDKLNLDLDIFYQ